MSKRSNDERDGAEMRSPLIEKIENFFYHYKWHTIVALFLVVVIVVTTVQTCSRESYDIYITYATDESVGRSSENGDLSKYQRYTAAFSRLCPDFDGNGESLVSLSDLFVPSPEKIEELGDNYAYSSAIADSKTLTDRFMYSEYYVSFISKHVYDTHHIKSGVEIFTPLEPYAPEDNDFVYYTESAIYLSSTPLYSLPGFSEMPEDTLICLRIYSEVTAAMGNRKSAETYERSEEYIREILKYQGN